MTHGLEFNAPEYKRMPVVFFRSGCKFDFIVLETRIGWQLEINACHPRCLREAPDTRKSAIVFHWPCTSLPLTSRFVSLWFRSVRHCGGIRQSRGGSELPVDATIKPEMTSLKVDADETELSCLLLESSNFAGYVYACIDVTFGLGLGLGHTRYKFGLRVLVSTSDFRKSAYSAV